MFVANEESIAFVCERRGGYHESENRQWLLAVGLAFVALILATPLARSGDDDEAKVKEAATQSAKAAEAFDEIMGARQGDSAGSAGAREGNRRFPRVIKAAFLVGGEGGRGCREPPHKGGLE